MITKRTVLKLLKEIGIDSYEVSGSGKDWSVTLPDEETKDQFCKGVSTHTHLFGYRTGWGGYVMKPDTRPESYKELSDLDYCNPANPIHW